MGSEKEAGRDLDALVAEKVMGWRRMTDGEIHPGVRFDEVYPNASGAGFGRDRLSDWWFDATARTADGDAVARRPVDDIKDYDLDAPGFSPSTSIADAWLVVENMIARGEAFSPIIQFAHFSGLWRVAFSVSQARDDAMRAESLPLAICRAALAVAEAQPTPENHSPNHSPTGGSGESE